MLHIITEHQKSPGIKMITEHYNHRFVLHIITEHQKSPVIKMITEHLIVLHISVLL